MRTEQARNAFNWELAAEAITVRIRWFGLCVGYVVVNAPWRESNALVLNAILTLGAVYALIDTYWSWRGKVFLSRWPLGISLLEAVFIGLLCHFDEGLDSPFRFFYFLSLLVCAFRYPPWITYSTFGLHSLSLAALTFGRTIRGREDLTNFFLMVVLMGWVTWASTALADLVKAASRRLSQLNDALKGNQALLEQRIQERTQALQESQALLIHREKQAGFGLLAAGIAHEVGNPLAAISSLVQLLSRRHNDAYTCERLQMVDDQLRRIQRTLRELVDFSRPATTETRLCDIHEVLDAALNIAKYYQRKKGKRIVTRYAEGLPNLRIVRDQLVQVFLNLIQNAMDAAEEGGTIELSTDLDAEWIRVTIRDDGPGIRDEDRIRIFQPYFTTKQTGTGLGLFVCKRIVEQMRGVRLELAESSEQGAAFTVFLSCALSEQPLDVPYPSPVSLESGHS